MRKLATAAMAVPTIAGIYLATLGRRRNATRLIVGILVFALAGAGIYVASGTRPTTATPPSVAVPLTNAAFRTAVSTGLELDAPISVEFSTPMDRASVAASIQVEPVAPVELDWDTSGRILTISPAGAWAPDTLHAVTVKAGALARTGRPLARPVRSAFLTRPATGADFAATVATGKRVRVDTGFTIAFSAPVEVASLAAAFETVPPVAGTLTPADGVARGRAFTFTPLSRLQPDTRYELRLSGVRTADGEVLADARFAVRTAKAPAVLRFRPRAKSTDVPREAAISVRFSQPMDRASTKKAFSIEAGGKAVPGKIRFAENDTVIVFVPSSRLPYSAKVVARVADTAESADGTPIAGASAGSFTVEKKPAPPKPKAAPRTTRTTTRSSGGGGSTGGGGSWGSVERYYLKLMNCTRTGGWVTSSGSCSSPGGRNVAALRLDSGISSKVARPYAKLLATRGLCSHYANGGPDDRLRRAGYTSYRWAENIGCRSGDPFKAVLGTHLYFQSEHSYNGGHWVNMMNSQYDRAGIGVYVSGGRVRLVVDFYHP
ncbi:MAG TPA: Ig-like domain-containing protein [Clostridia bacterium]|nr:Ig-like domain-containing protein [Clostridia bacterium]